MEKAGRAMMEHENPCLPFHRHVFIVLLGLVLLQTDSDA